MEFMPSAHETLPFALLRIACLSVLILGRVSCKKSLGGGSIPNFVIIDMASVGQAETQSPQPMHLPSTI
jgi:hypothetical protein